MSNSKLRAFVESQVSEAKKSKIDWDSRKLLWIQKVNLLYQQIESFMDDLIRENLVVIQKSRTTITEQYIGAYEIDRMLIKIGPNDILLSPIGTLIIAGRGRVDMKGPQGSVMLVLFGKGERPAIKFTLQEPGSPPPPPEKPLHPKEPEEYEWVIIKERGQKNYPILDQDSYLDALRTVIGDVESESFE